MSATPHLDELERALAELPSNVIGEIAFGRLVAQPRPAARHTFTASLIGHVLGSQFQNGLGGLGGWTILYEPELQLGPHVLVPDLAGWRVETMPSLPDVARFAVVPDWVCEVLSPSTADFDRDEKMLIYGANGVSHLWLVDPVARTVEAFRSARGRWASLGTFGDERSARIEPFESVALTTATFFSP